MAVTYKKLWILLIEKGLNKTELKDLSKITTSTLARLGKNEVVSMGALQRICQVLECNIGDIVDYVPDER